MKALRAAFDATMKDPEFLADAEKRGFDINPVSGEEMQKIVADIVIDAERGGRPAAVDHRNGVIIRGMKKNGRSYDSGRFQPFIQAAIASPWSRK